MLIRFTILLLVVTVTSCATHNKRLMPEVSDENLVKLNPKVLLITPVITKSKENKVYENFLNTHMVSIFSSVGYYVLPNAMTNALFKSHPQLDYDTFNTRFPKTFIVPGRQTKLEQQAKSLGADAVLYTELNTIKTVFGINIRMIMINVNNGEFIWNILYEWNLMDSAPTLQPTRGGLRGLFEGMAQSFAFSIYVLTRAIFKFLINRTTGYRTAQYVLRKNILEHVKKGSAKINLDAKKNYREVIDWDEGEELFY